jgi:hypothetical protein
MTDSAILELREEYESSTLKIDQFSIHKGLDYEKVRYALRKALRLRREACGDITFTAINAEHNSLYEKPDSAKHIIITTSNGTIIQIPS